MTTAPLMSFDHARTDSAPSERVWGTVTRAELLERRPSPDPEVRTGWTEGIAAQVGGDR